MDIANFFAYLSAGIAMGFGALGAGWGLGHAAEGAIRAMAKQPSEQSAIFRNMLISQAVTETPAIFSLVIAFMLYFSAGSTLETPNSLALAVMFLSTGICIGVGSIGSGAGSGIVAHEALLSMARNPSEQSKILMFMLIGQAWAQIGCIFALVISLLMLGTGDFGELSTPNDYHLFGLFPISAGEITSIGKYLGAAISMGAGAIGSSLGISFVGASACSAISRASKAASNIRTAFFIGSATAETPTIFALIVSLIIIIQG